MERAWAATTQPTMNNVTGTVTLTDTDDAFDFTLSGADPVPATMVVVLLRQ